MPKNLTNPSGKLSEPLLLNRLGNYLLLYFPLRQVCEILEDYQEYLSLEKERGNFERLTLELENPRTITQELLKETPQGEGLRRFRTWTAGWGLLAAITLYLYISPLRFSYISARLPLFALFVLSVFSLIHGRARFVLEQRLNVSISFGRCYWFSQLLIPLPVLLTESVMQRLLALPAGAIPFTIGKWPIGIVINSVLCLFIFLLCLILLWMLLQTFTRSIRYYPAAIHSLGAILFLLDMRFFLHRMDLNLYTNAALHQELMLPLWLYGAGILLAGVSAFFLKKGAGLWMHR